MRCDIDKSWDFDPAEFDLSMSRAWFKVYNASVKICSLSVASSYICWIDRVIVCNRSWYIVSYRFAVSMFYLALASSDSQLAS
jgi:hypothetical protein